MSFVIHKAQRKGAKMRCGITGIQFTGKTMSAILMAKGLAGGDLSKVVIIDSENGSADLYEHLGPYSVLPIESNYHPNEYIKRIDYCIEQGFQVIIIDSISHEWEGQGGCLDLHRKICETSKKNSFQAWADVTPLHIAFIDKILNAPVHFILCSRQKVEYSIDVDANGRKTVNKIGTKEITREGLAYELTCAFDLDKSHRATVTKDRTRMFDSALPFQITERTGQEMLEWCEMPGDLVHEFTRAKAAIANANTIDELKEIAATVSPALAATLTFQNEGKARQARIKALPRN